MIWEFVGKREVVISFVLLFWCWKVCLTYRGSGVSKEGWCELSKPGPQVVWSVTVLFCAAGC